MPRDSAGVYTLPPGNPVVTGTVIASPWANTTLSDIAAQLNNVLTRDGLLGPTAPFKVQDGTLAAPGLSWNSEPGLGFYRKGTSVLGLVAAGREAFLFTSAVNGTTFKQTAPANAANSIVLDRATAVGFTNSIYGFIGGLARWSIELGHGAAAADFGITRYNDAGAPIEAGFSINRANGTVALSPSLGVAWYKSGTDVRYTQGGNQTGNWEWRWNTANGTLTWNLDGGVVGVTIFGNGVMSANGFTSVAAGLIGLGANGANWRIVQEGNIVRQYFGNQVGQRFDWDAATGTYSLTNQSGSWIFRNDAAFIVPGGAYKPGGGAWSDSSDIRVKHDVRDYDHGLAHIRKLRPRTFKFKPETGRAQKDYVGFVYHESDAMPEMQDSFSDTLGDIQLDDMGHLDTSPLPYALVNAVNELDQRLRALEHIA